MRASPEKKLEKERIRLELMRATLRLAASHGFSSLGLREVSREAGIAPTSFYRHFADVEELGRGIIRELVSPAIASITSQVADGAAPAASQIAETIAEGLLDATDGDPELIRFVVAERVSGNSAIRESLRRELARLADALARVLPEGAPAGVAQAAITAMLDACDELIDHAPEKRAAARDEIEERMVAGTRWLMGATQAPAGNG